MELNLASNLNRNQIDEFSFVTKIIFLSNVVIL
jgi:hypothetical protein